jgi:hypothetical protein
VPDKLNLKQLASENFPAGDVAVIDARSRATAISWGFATLITTVVLSVAAYVALDIAKLYTNTLREWLQTTIAGEIGLIAGFSGSRNNA